MSYFDMLNALRKGEPDPGKATGAMKGMGWLCLGVAAWNFLFPKMAPSGNNPFRMPATFSTIALLGLVFLAALFFLSAQALRRRSSSGILLGQVTIALAMVFLCAVPFLFLQNPHFAGDAPTFKRVASIVLIVIIMQFLIPAWLGMRYLGRLGRAAAETASGVVESSFEDRSGSESRPGESAHAFAAPHPGGPGAYKEALLPFGPQASLSILIIGMLLLTAAGQRLFASAVMPVFFFPGFILVLLGPIVYNALPSTFERGRTPIFSCYAGGSLFMMHGSWPFFRLFIYSDGLEIRCMLHRFFIPYEKMKPIPEDGGFFSRGILIESQVPEVPSSIRLQPFGKESVSARIRAARAARLMEGGGSGSAPA